MLAKFQKLLDDAKVQGLSPKAIEIIADLIGDDPDQNWDAQDLQYGLEDPEALDNMGLTEEDEPAVDEAYGFLENYQMLAPFDQDYASEIAKGKSQAVAYATIFNAISDYTDDDYERKTLVRELDDDADGDISEKPSRDWYVFEDGSSVHFADGYAESVSKKDTDYELYARRVDKEDAEARREDAEWGE